MWADLAALCILYCLSCIFIEVTLTYHQMKEFVIMHYIWCDEQWLALCGDLADTDPLSYEQRCVATVRIEAHATTSQSSGSLTWSMAAAHVSGMVAVKATSTSLTHRSSVKLLVLSQKGWVRPDNSKSWHSLFKLNTFILLQLSSEYLTSVYFWLPSMKYEKIKYTDGLWWPQSLATCHGSRVHALGLCLPGTMTQRQAPAHPSSMEGVSATTTATVPKRSVKRSVLFQRKQVHQCLLLSYKSAWGCVHHCCY